MILPSPIRKFVAIFRGDVAPLLILLSAIFGIWFGMTPGWYGIHAVILVLALIFNTNIGLFIFLALLGRAIAYAAAPAMYYVGRFALESFGGLFDGLAALPILGLTDFTRYAVAGGTLLGPTLGLVVGLVLASMVTQFRKGWLHLEESSDKFKAWHNKGWVRWLEWFLVGKRSKDIRTTLTRKVRPIRLAGVAVAALVVVGVLIGVSFAGGAALRSVAERQLTAANGAEVNIGAFDLAVWSGRVAAREIQVTDVAKPSHNRFAVGELTADASVYDLFRGKLVIDELALSDVEADTPRASAGRVIDPTLIDAPEEPVSDEDLRRRFELPDTDLAKLEAYFKEAERVRDQLRAAAEWLPEPIDEEAEAIPAGAEPQQYLEYLFAKAYATPTPRVRIRRLALENVQLKDSALGRSAVEVLNLSDAPEAAGEPVTITVRSLEAPIEVKLVTRYDRPAGGADVEATVKDVDLARLQRSLSPRNPVKLNGGTAVANVSGTADREAVDLAIGVKTAGLQANATEAFFGLNPKAADEALKVVKELELKLRLVGPLKEPRLVFDGPAMQEELKEALVAAGKQEALNQLDKALADQLGEDTPKASDVLEDPVGKGKGLLEGLLKKKDKKKGGR